MWVFLVSVFLLISSLQAHDDGACSKWVHNVGSLTQQGGDTTPQALLERNFITTRSVTIGDGPFFVVNYGSGFDVPQAPQIMATIEKAAKIWAGALDNPVQVILNFEITELKGNIHGSLNYGTRYSTYEEFIMYLRNQDNQTQVEPWQSMVNTAASLNSSIHWNTGNSWWYNEIGISGAMWGAVTGQPNNDASIVISLDSSSLSLYDFDSTDGTGPGKYDFLTTVIHQLAHPLGWTTVVEGIDSFALGGGFTFLMFPWDLLRFTDATGINFATSERNMDPGAAHHYYWDGKLPSSIELSRGTNSGGADANHWINRNRTEVIGIMDPTLMDGQQIGISPADLSVLDAIGWKLQSPMIPMVDSFILNTNSTPSVKVMGYLMSPSVVCAFNGKATSPVTPLDTLASNSWRGVTCAIPDTLKFYNKKIYVQVSNDGKVWSPRVTIYDPLVTTVLPLPIPLINLMAANISMTGRPDVFLRGSPYSIFFEAIKFSTVFINSSALNFTARFSSTNAPVNNKKYLVTVRNSTWTSNQIEIYFQYAPVITSAFTQSNRLTVFGQFFGKTPSCEYQTPSFVTPATAQGTGFSCALPEGGVKVPFGVRVLAGGIASNWFTVVK